MPGAAKTRRLGSSLALALIAPVAGLIAWAAVSAVQAHPDPFRVLPRLRLPPVNPAARSGAAIAYDPERRTVVMFGGEGFDGEPLGDTWTWDGGNWTDRKGNVVPPPRTDASMVWDPAIHRLLLIGGIGAEGLPRSDTWTWDGRAWQAQLAWPIATANSPAAVTYDPVHHAVLLISTIAAVDPASGSLRTVLGTWVLKATGWARETGPNADIAGDFDHVMAAYDPIEGRIALIAHHTPGCGGAGAGTSLNLVPASSLPVCEPSQELNPVETGWWWDEAGWHEGGYGRLSGTASALQLDAGHGTNLQVLDGSKLLQWDGHQWDVQGRPAPFGLRDDASVASDPARGTVVIFGGRTATGKPGADTWTWDSRGWTYRTGMIAPPSPPSAPATRNSCQPSPAFFGDSPDSRGVLTLSISAGDMLPASCKGWQTATVQVIDVSSRRPLDIDNNARPLQTRNGRVTLEWVNWCASPDELPGIALRTAGGLATLTVLYPPPCLDTNLHSALRAP